MWEGSWRGPGLPRARSRGGPEPNAPRVPEGEAGNEAGLQGIFGGGWETGSDLVSGVGVTGRTCLCCWALGPLPHLGPQPRLRQPPRWAW